MDMVHVRGNGTFYQTKSCSIECCHCYNKSGDYVLEHFNLSSHRRIIIYMNETTKFKNTIYGYMLAVFYFVPILILYNKILHMLIKHEPINYKTKEIEALNLHSFP